MKTAEYPVPVPKLSPSAILSYKNCPKQFEYQKVLKIYGPGTPETIRGSFVHEVLEYLFKEPAEERTIDTAKLISRDRWDNSLDKYSRKTWKQRAIDAGVPESEMSQFLWQAWYNIKTYFDMEDPTVIEPVALETWVEGAVINGIEVRGIVDRIVYTDDGESLVVQDYKTGKSHDPSAPWDADKQVPLMIYAELTEDARDKEVPTVELLYLSDGKRVTYETSPENREAMYRTVTETYERIVKSCETGDFPTNKTKLCDWCDHKQYCPAWSTE